jgi:hypothetical protein
MNTEVITLLVDGEWRLQYHERGSSVQYWLLHSCEDHCGAWWTTRFLNRINDPCETCGGVCPEALQGMYNMMEFL